jgi:hypothetical protein
LEEHYKGVLDSRPPRVRACATPVTLANSLPRSLLDLGDAVPGARKAAVRAEYLPRVEADEEGSGEGLAAY